jgi:hypothetical protein
MIRVSHWRSRDGRAWVVKHHQLQQSWKQFAIYIGVNPQILRCQRANNFVV